MSVKILLIDDDPDFLMATSLILEKDGYEVFTAHNGTEGLAKSGELNPDLIIVDLMMDTWSEGYDVVETLRNRSGSLDTPIIILSAVDMSGPYDAIDYAASPESGVSRVLRKPIKAEDLLEYVKALVKT